MNRFIEIDGMDGTLLIEVEGDNDTLELVNAKSCFSSLSNIMTSLISNGKTIVEKATKLAPNEIELEFGIKGGIEAGVPVWGLAKASGEGNISIKMCWKELHQNQ